MARTTSRPTTLSAAIFAGRKPSWKSFFCGGSVSGDHWAETTTSSFILPIPREEDEDENTSDFDDISVSDRQRLLSSTDDGFEDEKVSLFLLFEGHEKPSFVCSDDR